MHYGDSHIKKLLLIRRRRGRWKRIVMYLAVSVVLSTTYVLVRPAVTKEVQPVCALEEHTHADHCYEQVSVLACTLEEEMTGHTHQNECYVNELYLVCDKVEHTHTALCDESQETGDFSLEEEAIQPEEDPSYDTQEQMDEKESEGESQTMLSNIDPDTPAESGYVFPSTGGMGPSCLTTGGAILMISSSLVYLLGYRREDKGGSVFPPE